jgi:hypothetical protein
LRDSSGLLAWTFGEGKGRQRGRISTPFALDRSDCLRFHVVAGGGEPFEPAGRARAVSVGASVELVSGMWIWRRWWRGSHKEVAIVHSAEHRTRRSSRQTGRL